MTVNWNQAVEKFKSKYFIYFIPAIIAIFLYFVLVPATVIGIILIVCYGGLYLSNFLSNKSESKDYEDIANEYFKKKWRELMREELSFVGARVTSRYFAPHEDALLFSYIVFRSTGARKYQPLVAVIQVSPLCKRDWDENPRPEKLNNPFIDVSPNFVGAPTRVFDISWEPSLKSSDSSQKEKKKKEGDSQEKTDEAT